MTLSFSPRRILGCLVPLLLSLTSLNAQDAQDTLGSLVPDTPITLIDGSTVAVQDLKGGAKIWTWMPTEKPAEGKVTGIRRVHSDTYISLKAGTRQLEATGSHRIALADGKLVRLDTVKEGDKITVWGPKGAQDAVVTSIRPLPVTLITYDLTIEGHRMFLVDSIVVGD